MEKLVKKNLNPGEIVLQWIPTNWPLTPLGAFKNAYVSNWQSSPYHVNKIADEINEGKCKAIGVLGGPCFNERFGLVWIDVDGVSVKSKVEELSHLSYEEALPPTLTICSGRPGRERRLYKVLQEDFMFFVRNKYAWQTDTPGEKLEILWSNCQGVLMGLHPETNGFYTPEGLGFEWADDLPLVPNWILDCLVSKNARTSTPAKRVTRVEGPGFGFSLIQDTSRDRSMAIEALWSLSGEMADDYDTWIMVGQALHSVDEDLLDQWDAWSQQSEKYEPGVCFDKWATFNSGNGVGLGSLIELSKAVSNVVYERLEKENASLPEDEDLDQIEKIRLHQMLMMDGLIDQTVENTQHLEHIQEVLMNVAEHIEEVTGETFVSEWADQIEETSSVEETTSNLKRNPPVNVLRDLILKEIGKTVVYDINQESYYQYSAKSEGLWSQLTPFEMSALIQRHLDEMYLPKGYSSGTVQSLLDLIGPKLSFSRWNNNADLLCFKNGVLNTKTKEFMPHSREFYMVSQLPFDYISDADCPRTRSWLSFTQYSNGEMVKVLQAWLRAVLLSAHQIQMFMEVVGAAGAGKAQPDNALVLTAEGWREIGSLVVGDQVLAATGAPATVMGVYPQGKKDIYKVSFDDGTSAQCCNQHLWQVCFDSTYKNQILTLEEIRAHRNQNPNVNVMVPLNRAVQFKRERIDEEPYAYARLIIGSIEAQKKLQQNSETLNSILPDNLGVQIDSIPIQYRMNTIAVRLHLLQGLMDLAGDINKKTGQCIFNCHAEYLALEILSIVRSLGGKGTVKKKDSTRLKNKHESYDVVFEMSPEFCPFRLNQDKISAWQNAYAKSKAFVPYKTIVDIEWVARTEARCIYIDNPEHLYITDGYTVTHNTSFSNLCVALVGTQNTFSTRLNLLETNRFEVSGAYNKKLVVISDSERYGGSVDMLKTLTGGDQIRMEFKYQKHSGSGFVYRGLVMATANESIQSTDPTAGLFRRRLTVPFSRPRWDQKDLELIAFDHEGNPYGHLADELPGVVNWVLSMSHDEMLDYTKNATKHIAVMKEQRAEQISESNNVIDWMHERIVFDPNVSSIVGEKRDSEGEYYYKNAEYWLYASYCDHCRKSSIREMGKPRFVRVLEDVCTNQLRIKIKKIKGTRTRHMFKGLAIRKSGDGFHDGYPSIVDYAFNQHAYEHLYGNKEMIQQQIEDETIITNRSLPGQRSGIPDLPF
jgi:phage/plasmid-associated DNA primase